jgi:hypothetical protein
MSRKFLIPLLAVVFLTAPAAFGPAAPLGLSGSAQAKVNNTTTRSNTQHNITATKRMGGGGGRSGGSGAARMGGGGGVRTNK